jgi:tape measure domain-containing protein
MARQIQIDILANDRTKQAFNSVKKNTDSTKQSLLSFKNILVTVASSVVIKQFLDLSNAYQNLQNRLKLVTNSTQELAFVQEKLFEVAQRTRGGFAETVELYQKLALQAKNLSLRQQDLVQITENVNKVIAIAGVGSAQASAGLLQLSQAFASGRLQGDEFRSISENIPPLLDIFAKQLGVTRGELKKLGSEGKITSDVIATALLNNTEKLNSQFGQLSPTIGQATVTVGNSILNLAGKFNEASGFSDLFAESLINLSNLIDRIADKKDKITTFFDAVEEGIRDTNKILDIFNTSLKDQFDIATSAFGRNLGILVDNLNTAGVGFSGFREAEEKSLESLLLYKGALEETNTELLRFKQLGSQNSKQLAENFKKEEKEARLLKGLSDGYRTANTELGRFGQTMKDNSSIIDEINTDHFPVFNRTILEATNFLGRFDEFSARTFNNFADYLTDAVMTGKASFKDFARSVLRDLASVIIRQQLAIATQRLFGGMGGTTNVLSTIGGAITGIFGRANGGTVQANKPYLIGERGAELFVPNTNGTVVPNNQMKSSGTNVNITINTVDARGIDELLTDRRSTIVNLINDALNSQGREALV